MAKAKLSYDWLYKMDWYLETFSICRTTLLAGRRKANPLQSCGV
jgi:hypothetical protein